MIARSKDAVVELVDIVIPDPDPHDVIVKVQACGVCHTDLTSATAASTTNSHSCSATKPPASSTPSATESPTSPSATSSSSTGAQSAENATPANAADFPTLADLYMQGRLPLEKFVTERIDLGGVEKAFHRMHAGEVLRSVVVL